MSTPFLGTVPSYGQPPSVIEFVIAWLLPLGDPTGVGMDRPSGAVLPYRMVTRVDSQDDRLTDSSIVSIHTFADSMTDAETAARATHARMTALDPRVAVTLPSGGTASADYFRVTQGPIWADYEDNTIRRFIARYEIDLRYLAA